ncbi:MULTISPECIES: helix-turn-helix domain-containing protein [unclassified Streptomyces]|uniref:helix-turn-helix domain-containing protein n=1 Tax=unclassified Streptomyces TaxID=2593676 RepID=UPI001BE5191E|nr:MULTISPECIES: helix-turn-helix transcriptional regulator [unclassified Streptomyces]MBT2403547.1 helix-turn-helix transcriptional regulator [Streptomyces sp. ISL-21]MBT2458766.1 helix-turn-helix transcriptional regulator [Streptomyces sp. ISL-86]MBT2609976.1 helix-turn-helix transcriptional regulator [Streptomyces sp. ISL-87]
MEFGELMRDLRKARGWSQGRLASAINATHGTTLTREYVSNWERSRVTPGAFYLAALSATLDVPLAVLEGQVDRREFLTDVAGVAIAPVVASDLLSAGFAARLSGGPSVDAWEAKLTTYGTEYMSLGAADIQRRVSAELVTVQQQLDNPRLWSVAARLMTLYAKTFPGSDGAKAVHWYRMAAKAADESGDDDARVWVRGRAAIALGYEGAALGVADVLADQAIAISDRPSLGLLNAIFGKAHAAAIRGDHATARKLLTDGRRVFDQAGSHEQTSDYAVPWWRVNVFISLLAARLGDEATAVAAQEAARTELPYTLPRFATHLELHRGLMLARSGDVSGGTAYARTALDALPPKKHSLTLRLLMAEVEQS